MFRGKKEPAMRFRHALCLVVGLPLLSLGGCATVLNGSHQTIHVETDPPGATVTVAGETHTSPVDLVLKRSSKDLVVVIEKEGYVTRKIALERGASKNTWLNFIGVAAGGAAGAAIGASQGHDELESTFTGAAGVAVGAVALPALMFAVDGATGAIHRLDPPMIAVKLEPASPPAASASASGVTP